MRSGHRTAARHWRRCSPGGEPVGEIDPGAIAAPMAPDGFSVSRRVASAISVSTRLNRPADGAHLLTRRSA